MTVNQTETAPGNPSRALLDTLIERWQEVADAYKPGDLPWDDIDRKYRDQRLIYLRNIRDLRHVLDTGQAPCSLMTDDERRRGDCGRIHEDTYDKHGRPANDPWPPKPDTTSEVPDVFRQIIVARLAEMLLAPGSDEVRQWARNVTFELKSEGVDLTGDIEKRIAELTLGRDPSDPPF